MAYFEKCRENLPPCKIEGQKKPFIDKNLQLQLPGCDLQTSGRSLSSSPSRIYSHFSSLSNTDSQAQVNEAELLSVMAEAESSFKAWKKLQNRLKDAIQGKVASKK